MIKRNLKGQFIKGMTYVMKKGHRNKLSEVAKKGENHWFWKGDKVGYKSLHEWVYRKYGKPKICEKCGAIKNLEWALGNKKQSRDLKDWIQLCRSCHKRYDKIIHNIKKMRKFGF